MRYGHPFSVIFGGPIIEKEKIVLWVILPLSTRFKGEGGFEWGQHLLQKVIILSQGTI